MKKTILALTIAAVLVSVLAINALAFTQAYSINSLQLNGNVAIGDAKGGFGDKAVWGTTRDDAKTTHFATLKVNVPADGKYYIWLYVTHTGTTDNSLFLSVNGGTAFSFDFIENVSEYYNIWYWMYGNSREDAGSTTGVEGYMTARMPKALELKKGDNEIKLFTREPGAKYSAIILTDDDKYDPNKDTKLDANKIDPLTVYGGTGAVTPTAPAQTTTKAGATGGDKAPDTGSMGFILLGVPLLGSALVVYRLRKA